MKIIVFFLSVTFFNVAAQSKVYEVLSSHATIDVNRGVEYLIDTNKSIPINQVPNQKFSVYEKASVLNISKAYLTAWLKISIKNSTNSNLALKIDNVLIDSAQVYFQKDDSLIMYDQSGYLINQSDKSYATPEIILKLPVNQNETNTLYIRLKAKQKLFLPMQIGTEEAIYQSEVQHIVFDALFFGALLILVIYNFILYLIIKDKLTLYFVFAMLSYSFFMIFWNGYTGGFDYNTRLFLSNDGDFLLAISTVGILLFAYYFLNVDNGKKIIKYIFIALIAYNLIDGLLFEFILPVTHIDLIVLVSAIFLFGCSIFQVLDGKQHVRFYAFGWFLYLLAILTYVLMIFNVLPFFTWTKYILPIGSLFEITFFSVALGDRFLMIEKENKRILEHSLKIERQLNEELSIREEELASSEEELRVSNESLTVYNEDLYRLFEEEVKLNEELARNKEELAQKEKQLTESYQEMINANQELNRINTYIKEREEVVSAVFDNSTDIIVSVDANLIITFANKTFKEIFKKFTNDDYKTGIPVLKVIPQDKTDFYMNTYKKVLAGEHVYQVTENEEEMWGKYISEEFYSPIRNANKEVTGIAIFIRDITERVKAQKETKENEFKLIEMNKQMAELKLMALRSVMNPHFVFNALNSIQYFISNNDRKNAIVYLSMFSKLIRGVLNSSIKNTIQLNDEIEILKYYIELEKVRFGDKFEAVFEIDQRIDLEEVEIPSLLIQPYVENAILHGLYNKEGKGTLKIIINQLTEDQIECIIEDDGIGRAEALAIKNKSASSHKSVAMMVTKERLQIINLANEVSQEIEDLVDSNGKAIGTKVRLIVTLN
ncbi:MAG: 7TM diverse intracellular signaling domain-containing protein [Bacteroidota bacterium]|nr:7TM diverse intracellular signaling domain-containing protein [Bacteroidota bacterium]